MSLRWQPGRSAHTLAACPRKGAMVTAAVTTVIGRGFSRVIEFTLILLGIASIVQPLDSANVDVAVLGCWDLVAVLYLVIRWQRIRRSRKHPPGNGSAWLKGLLGRRTGFLFTLVASFVGITAGLTIVIASPDGDSELDLVTNLVGVPAVIAAWLILHFGYSERYAHLFYDHLPEQAMAFPGTERPTMLEFAYFAFTLGTSFAVSDVEVRTSRVRSLVLGHSVLSFFYNTAILGIAIGVISGAAK